MEVISNHFSKIALFIVAIAFVLFRFSHIQTNEANGYNATSWDAFGYYMYLPSTFIYNDVSELKWVPKIDSIYHVTGGQFYQAIPLENGQYTNKYLGGVAILQTPYFLIGHFIAKNSKYAADGFSAPYQYSILFGAILSVFLGLLILRNVLLRFFEENVVAYTLLFLGLTSNLIQYTSIDGAMSHAFIFPLYSILIWATIKWHQNQKLKFALLIGGVIGLATICRPTELVMIFIPILWNTTNKVIRKEKWQIVGRNKSHIIFAALAGSIAMLPQILYWHHTTGKFIFDVGSKWFFFNPWFRVLVGPEKGWFLYTPVAILMILGYFKMRGEDFKRSILTFGLINIWIIIAWSDWRYGASYSTRALVQSYPVYAFGLACFIRYVWNTSWRWSIVVLLFLFTVLNFYQLSIYNNGVFEDFSPFLANK